MYTAPFTSPPPRHPMLYTINRSHRNGVDNYVIPKSACVKLYPPTPRPLPSKEKWLFVEGGGNLVVLEGAAAIF